MKKQSETNTKDFNFEQFIEAGNAANNEKLNGKFTKIVNNSFDAETMKRMSIESMAFVRSDVYALVMGSYRACHNMYDVYALAYCCDYSDSVKVCNNVYFSLGGFDLHAREMYITYEAALRFFEMLKKQSGFIEDDVEIFRFWFEKTYGSNNRYV